MKRGVRGAIGWLWGIQALSRGLVLLGRAIDSVVDRALGPRKRS